MHLAFALTNGQEAGADGGAAAPSPYAPVSDITLTASWSQDSQTMHRLYNPNSGERFYTARAAERDMLRRVGWRAEGVGWYGVRAS